MSFFLIDIRRLLRIIGQPRHQTDVFNWWVDFSNNKKTLNVTLNIRNVSYLYRQEFNTMEEIRMEIKSLLTSDRSVLGYLTGELNPKQENSSPPLPSLGLNIPSDFLDAGAL